MNPDEALARFREHARDIMLDTCGDLSVAFLRDRAAGEPWPQRLATITEAEELDAEIAAARERLAQEQP